MLEARADYGLSTNSYFSVSKSSKNDGYKKLDIGKIKNESTNNLTDKSSKSIEVYGATYIQDGIKQGADILINEKTTTYTDSVSGQKVQEHLIFFAIRWLPYPWQFGLQEFAFE